MTKLHDVAALGQAIWLDYILRSFTAGGDLQALLDKGVRGVTLATGLPEARADLARIAEQGIDLDAITEQLQADAVASFAQSFESLMASIRDKCVELPTTQSA